MAIILGVVLGGAMIRPDFCQNMLAFDMPLFDTGMVVVRDTWVAMPLLVMVGIFSGFFVVPMNALLQHRGHILMGAGHSIAVQNFNENLSILILIMTGIYSLLIWAGLHIYWGIS
ncbi:MAG: hypothetical protein KGZ43_11930 [Sulfuritalea sp.]|nr:hypothetical protein [Sulfuritalea sp.]